MTTSPIEILLVEDSSADALLVRTYLADASFEEFSVEHVPDLKGALEALGRRTFDVVLLDVCLPGSRGLDAFTFVSALARSAAVILLTGFADEELGACAVRLGAQDFLMKNDLSGPLLARALRYAVERSTTVERLRESEAFLQSTVDAIALPIAILDEAGVVISANTAWRAWRSVADDGTRNPYRVPCLAGMTAEGEEPVYEGVERLLREAGPSIVCEYLCVGPEGERAFLVHASRFNAKGGVRVVMVHEDVTEIRRAEAELRSSQEQLRQAQKMEAMGRLAGGVAHDFNNLLTVITGYTELVLRRVAPGDPVSRDFQEVLNAAHSASALTRQLLAFSRKQVLDPRVVDVNRVIEELVKMLKRLIGEDVRLRTELDPEGAVVLADPGQLEQVLANLAVNARDAMPRGGELTIATWHTDVAEKPGQQIGGPPPGRYVVLEVIDTGCGMDEETLARIFEPFYTTKAEGKGTGLGLATVYGIVTQSGGTIAVDSTPGRGTTFRVYLPASAGEGIGRRPARRRGLMVPHGTETILLVEDEPAVRVLAREVLSRAGYTVLEAEHGLQALEVVHAHPGRIDLAVSDLVMPEMDGLMLRRELLERMPGLPVLLMSGYSEGTSLYDEVVTERIACIEKPFQPSQLAVKVREVLDAASLRANA